MSVDSLPIETSFNTLLRQGEGIELAAQFTDFVVNIASVVAQPLRTPSSALPAVVSSVIIAEAPSLDDGSSRAGAGHEFVLATVRHAPDGSAQASPVRVVIPVTKASRKRYFIRLQSTGGHAAAEATVLLCGSQRTLLSEAQRTVLRKSLD